MAYPKANVLSFLLDEFFDNEGVVRRIVIDTSKKEVVIDGDVDGKREEKRFKYAREE